MTPDRPPVRIGLVWHSLNSDNLGVGALTLAHIEILEEAARALGLAPKFIILGWTDPKPLYLQKGNVEVAGLRLKDFVKPVGGLFGRLKRCDLVFDIGAGDSFADIYGLKRFGTVWASKALTLLAGRPLILSPQTIGPFNRGWARWLAGSVMKRATALSTRDDLSTRFLRSMGYKGEIIEASDVALRLSFQKPVRASSEKLRVGLNVSGLLFNGGYNRSNMFGLQSDYADLVRRIVRQVLERKDAELHLVPHVVSDAIAVEDDHRANLALAEEFPEVLVAPKFGSPIEAKSYIAGMDFFAGARMHACIAAFSSGVPVLPMAYSRKFAGLFGSIGYDILADCRSDSADEIVAKFEDALDRREELKLSAESSLAWGLARLQRYEEAASEALRRAVSAG
ncbi:polysaccharide pyruvyl transferase family protein [Frigidibacter sp. ROC022]|uniref:polysaccharide pyruvyl transferase family protein n=1 Tax=Frigidibacter sp. ROC022 TaxID=2971796 RepID=UPI00215A961F|nr:polysaccharide pyruvyl transferase family protein [Frigidibacter sp. ROC022]MCR8726844.1 polysaccharide pyruvyl transferase family protein [Frigidibacter sp. ROC022]